MAKKETADGRLRALAAKIPDERITRTALLVIHDNDQGAADRTVACIGAEFVNKALETCLLSKFRALSDADYRMLFVDEGAIYHSFSARIKAAFAMNFFDLHTRHDLNRIRSIRNAFAHATEVIFFSDPEVAEVCGLLSAPERVTLLGQYVPDIKDPRGRFVESVIYITHALKHMVEPREGTPAGLANSAERRLYQKRMLP